MHDKKCSLCHKNKTYYKVHTVAYQWYERLLIYPIFRTIFYIKKSNTSVLMHISQTSYISGFGLRDMTICVAVQDRYFIRVYVPEI